jgi:hypothetical protein
MSLVIQHGRLFDVVGQARCSDGIWFVPACGEIDHPADAFSHLLQDRGPIPFPDGGDFDVADMDSLWVRAAISGLFQYAPLHVADGRLFLLDALFFAVLLGAGRSGVAYPFACTDDGPSTGLVFSQLGPDAQVRERIATAFWRLLFAQGPEHLSTFAIAGVELDEYGDGGEIEVGYSRGHFYVVNLSDPPDEEP